MKYYFTGLLCSLLFCANYKSVAQVYIKPAALILVTSNTASTIPGGNIEGSYKFADKIEVGISVSIFPEKKSNKQFAGGLNVNYADAVNAVNAVFSYPLKTSNSKLLPFIGADAGVNFAKQKISFVDNSQGQFYFSKTSTNIMISPKAGISYMVGKNSQLLLKVQYHQNLNETEKRVIGVSSQGEAIELNPIQHYLTIGLGVAFRL